MGRITFIKTGEYFKKLIKTRTLIHALEKGEKGEKIHSFDRDKNLEDLHEAFIDKLSGKNQ